MDRNNTSLPVVSAAIAVVATLCAWQTGVSRADDLTTVRQRVVSDLLDSVPSASTVNGYTTSLNSNGSWSDIDYNSTADVSWNPLTHLDRLEAMAEAYSSSSSSLYHNAALKTSILKAYDYWISKDPQSQNWYHNEISAPQQLSDAMVLLDGILSSSQRTKGLSVLQRAYVSRNTNSGTNTGSNRVLRAMVGVNRGIVADSNSITADAFGAIGDTLKITSGSGMQRDGSFFQHGKQLYNSGYGSDFVSSAVAALNLNAGTTFAFNDSQTRTLVDYLLDGTQWMVRGQVIDYTTSGRNITRKNQDDKAASLSGQLLNVINGVPDYRNTELKAFRARIRAANDTGSADASLSLSGSKHFWQSDFTVTQRSNYYASVKTSSTRTTQPETGNDEGLKNLYLADGVNLILRTGNEYDNIMPVWNWRRLPGTTVEQDSRSLKPTDAFGVSGTATYAGGVSDGTYSAAAFKYDRYNVAARKSWFFFDQEFVAAGAAINAASATSNVNTTLNQTLLKGTVSYKTASDNSVKTVGLGDAVTPSGLKWVFHDGVGYFFPVAADNATIRAATQTGTWKSINQRYDDTTVNKDVFTLYLNHGKQFTGGSYLYLVVPGLTVGKMDAYLADNPINVLKNTSSVQAVRQTQSDITQAAFYSAGSVTFSPGQSFSVDAPSALLLRRPENAFQLTASSPEAKSFTLGVNLSDAKFSGQGTTWLDGFVSDSTVKFSLPDGDYVGSSVGFNIATDADATPVIRFQSTGQTDAIAYTANANLALPANTNFNTNTNVTATFNGVISGTGLLTKTGGGTLSLSGKNSYSGGTAVRTGNVNVSGNQNAANGGWTIGPDNASDVTVNFRAASNVKVGANGQVQIGNTIPSGSGKVSLNAAGTVANDGTLLVGRNATLNVTGDWTQSGDLSIVARGSEPFSPVLSVPNGGSFTYTGASTIKLDPAPSSTGNASLVIGDDSGAGLFTTSRGFERTVSGGDGNSFITLQNNGKIVFTEDVQRMTTGDIRLKIGSVAGVIDTKGFYAGLDTSISNLSGKTGGLTKRGNGTLELFAASQYQGDTVIGNGTLKVSNTAGSATGGGNVVIQSGATLTGKGAIAGSINVQAGGTISPGNSPGTLSTGAQTWSAGSIYRFEVDKVDASQVSQSAYQGTDRGADWLNIAGRLTLNGTAANPIRLEVSGLSHATHGLGAVTDWNSARNYSWVISTASDSIAGFSADAFDINTSDFRARNTALGAWSVSRSGKDVLLNYRVSTVSLSNSTSQASPILSASSNPQWIDVTNSNAGSVRISALEGLPNAPLKLVLDVKGLSDLNAFISHLQATPNGQGVVASNITGNAPAWIEQLGAGNWNVLLSFEGGGVPASFAWDFAQDAGVFVDRIAIAAVPEPTGLAVIGAAGVSLLRRPRRNSSDSARRRGS